MSQRSAGLRSWPHVAAFPAAGRVQGRVGGGVMGVCVSGRDVHTCMFALCAGAEWWGLAVMVLWCVKAALLLIGMCRLSPMFLHVQVPAIHP